jgi:hypothetical protein
LLKSDVSDIEIGAFEKGDSALVAVRKRANFDQTSIN